MPDIFDEVEEDLRADRLRRMLVRYGGLLVAAALLAVLGVAGYEAWKWYDGRRNAAVAELYLKAVTAADSKVASERDAARPIFEDVMRQGGAGYRTLARLRLAGLLADGGDRSGADGLWEQVAADRDADKLLRDVANLQWAMHGVDAGDAAAVAARLAPLASSGGPWHGLAQEQQALLDLRLGKTDAAREVLRLLVQDTSAPEGVRRRAGGLLDQIGIAPAAKGGGS